ncbi:MAG: 4Fe-4S ferredoxin [Ignavibacteria bacterium]|nr:MAG: 4Fe-4S ferredoxin [Ignavibacteria bacterium]KAF0156676.1 MAG: 4Fe-4S ferredoxin [Ignavibacteria bacterium]
MIRKIIQIEEEKCDGCGVCVPECFEGALQIIDGKVRLISDLFCDGLGACLGHCPTGALTIVEREAEPYDERKVMDYIVKGGPNVIKAHLKHLRDHKEFEFLTQAIDYLNDHGIAIPAIEEVKEEKHASHGCTGSIAQSFESNEVDEDGQRQSHLTQWPIQMHLVSPTAAYYRNSDLLLAADCCAFSYGDFHKDFMKGKSVAIACPKLDANKQVYLDKLITMINDANIKSITVAIMQVPCCSGLAQLAQQAREHTGREIPVSVVVIGVQGEILQNVEL